MSDSDSLLSPPRNEAAERAVLASILIDERAGWIALNSLSPADFFGPRNQAVFGAISDLMLAGQPVDIASLRTRLLERQTPVEMADLRELIESIPSAANARYHAHLVREASLLRAAYDLGQRIQVSAAQPPAGAKVAEILDGIEADVLGTLSRRLQGSEAVPIGDLIRAELSRLSEARATPGITTEYPLLDHLTQGFRPSELIVVAARPSVGKTSFALSLLLGIVSNARVPTLFFSLEMDRTTIAQNAIGQCAGVSPRELRSGKITDYLRHQVETQAANLVRAPLYIDDGAGQSIVALRAKARLEKMRHGIGLVAVDYLQLVEGIRTKGWSREQEVAGVSRGLKALAKELQVPVIALAQLNRAIEARGEGSRPRLSDLRESGSLEQDADMVLLLWREDYQRSLPSLIGKAEVIIAKNRNGPTGKCDFYFHSDTMRWVQA